MATNPQKRSSNADMALRRQGGQWLKRLREARGFSQTEFVKRLTSEPPHYSFVSQIEIGVSRIPPELYAAWADVLDVPRREFGMQLLRFYDPKMFVLMADADVETADVSAAPPES